jgi:hypothetical protein
VLMRGAGEEAFGVFGAMADVERRAGGRRGSSFVELEVEDWIGAGVGDLRFSEALRSPLLREDGFGVDGEADVDVEGVLDKDCDRDRKAKSEAFLRLS